MNVDEEYHEEGPGASPEHGTGREAPIVPRRAATATATVTDNGAP